MPTAIKYFTVFGGIDIQIDTTKPLLELVEKHILKEYNSLRSEVNYLTGGYSVDHAILSGIALGDRKTTNAFKRAHVSFEEGMKCVDSLCEKGIIETESSQHFMANKRSDTKIAKKLLFTNPFMRFWFGFVSPIYKGIKEGNFEEFYSKFAGREADFSDFIFEELALAYLKVIFEDDPVKQIGQYWDEKIQITPLAKTNSGKVIAGYCKYSDTKMKKSELNTLLQNCQNSGIVPDIVVLFAKNGYSTELKSLKSENLRLFSAKSLKSLLN
jgi:AAA+ ATPase superfamily predicted ATPase